jgi:hypothetical protein
MDAGGGVTRRRAFLSHASEDKASFAEPLGRELARLGVQPWLDKWEIRPGDSLVRKLFDEGLATVDAVIVIVSAFSADKRWVREELDAAMISRITSDTRLIPVRLDQADMPAPLRHLVWITSDRSPPGVHAAAAEIVDTIYGRDLRPAVADPPVYTSACAVPGLTSGESLLLTRLAEQAISQGHLLPGMNWVALTAVVQADGLREELAAEAAQTLSHAGFVALKGAWQSKILRIHLTHLGFGSALRVMQPGYGSIEADVTSALINDPPGDVASLAERIGLPIVVAQYFVSELQDEGLLKYREYIGGGSRIYDISPALRRRAR